MRRLVLMGALLSAQTALHAALHAAPHKARPARDAGQVKAWIAKKAGEGVWCSFSSEKAALDGIAAEELESENRAIVRYDRTRIVSIEVSNDDDDSFADDIYQFDAAMRVTRMVRTGKTGEEPSFSLTYAPDRTGELVLTPASRDAMERLDDADRDTGISDWARFRGFDYLPFRNLIARGRGVSVRRGCAPAAS